jgi:dolichol-phosphate mannosyltransferase
MNSPTILVIIPTYNEAENIPVILQTLLSLPHAFDILFVDDSSPDGTANVIRSFQGENSRVRLLLRPGKLGIGSAHRDGILWAYEHRYDVAATMDADLTHSPEDLGRLLSLDIAADVLVASRFKSPGSLPGWSLTRRVITHLGHYATQLLLGLPYDATGALRIYKINNIPRRLFQLAVSNGYAYIFESLLYLHVNGITIAEVPITLPARILGSSKMSKKEFIRSVKALLLYSLFRIFMPDRLRVSIKIDPLGNADTSEWDSYWTLDLRFKPTIFSILAGFYRRLLIRPALEWSLRKYFPEKSLLLHTGCGSGQVDARITSKFDITALDLSRRGLEVYLANNGDFSKVVLGSLFSLPFPDNAFDGIYNLGVMEHFREDEIQTILRESARVLKPGGKLLMWWPPEYGSSTILFKIIEKISRHFRKATHTPLVPPEVSRLKSEAWARERVEDAGLRFCACHFGPRDLFTQVLVVAQKTHIQEPGHSELS